MNNSSPKPIDDFGWHVSLKSVGKCEDCEQHKLCAEITRHSQPVQEIPTPEISNPTNSTALAFYLLLKHPTKGVNQYEAVLSDKFFKFGTRVSDLILKHKVNIHKKPEDGENRFGHSYQNTRYCLYITELERNIELYNKINEKK